jgi:hypothetical protein
VEIIDGAELEDVAATRAITTAAYTLALERGKIRPGYARLAARGGAIR